MKDGNPFWKWFTFFPPSSVLLGIKPGSLGSLGKHSYSELHPVTVLKDIICFLLLYHFSGLFPDTGARETVHP